MNILQSVITDKNSAYARLVAAQQAVARWPSNGNPLPAKLAAEQTAAEVAYRAAQQRVADLLQRRRENMDNGLQER